MALSIALRRPGVTWQPTLWSSDFPRPEKIRTATVTPHHLTKNIASPMHPVKHFWKLQKCGLGLLSSKGFMLTVC